jgi:hypothetical protein
MYVHMYLHAHVLYMHAYMAHRKKFIFSHTCHLPSRYADYDALRPVFTKQLSYGDNLLVVGPGLSALHERLYDRWGSGAGGKQRGGLAHHGAGRMPVIGADDTAAYEALANLASGSTACMRSTAQQRVWCNEGDSDRGVVGGYTAGVPGASTARSAALLLTNDQLAHHKLRKPPTRTTAVQRFPGPHGGRRGRGGAAALAGAR